MLTTITEGTGTGIRVCFGSHKSYKWRAFRRTGVLFIMPQNENWPTGFLAMFFS